MPGAGSTARASPAHSGVPTFPHDHSGVRDDERSGRISALAPVLLVTTQVGDSLGHLLCLYENFNSSRLATGRATCRVECGKTTTAFTTDSLSLKCFGVTTNIRALNHWLKRMKHALLPAYR